ncbi:MAG: hypothetical protein J0H77_08240 [Alphaproteobacteria bacterium]|nr:hypothetical protein [Alphaproteobacteria bacterium]
MSLFRFVGGLFVAAGPFMFFFTGYCAHYRCAFGGAAVHGESVITGLGRGRQTGLQGEA